MTYRVIVLPSALREIKKLPKDVQQRIAARIPLLENNPRPNGAIKLQGDEAYRLRIGDYRVIYTIDDDIVTVTIIRAGHRREIYR